jgi:hypothetical protein
MITLTDDKRTDSFQSLTETGRGSIEDYDARLAQVLE